MANRDNAPTIICERQKQKSGHQNQHKAAPIEMDAPLLFPDPFPISDLDVECELTTNQLISIPRIFFILNNLFLFNRREFDNLIGKSNLNLSDIKDISKNINTRNRTKLNRLMLSVGIKSSTN